MTARACQDLALHTASVKSVVPIVGEIQHHTVSLEDEVNFYDWSSQRWPSPRYKVELRPWSGSPGAWPLVPEQR